MSSPWMPLYVADFLADTAHLDAEETGAYMCLIMHYWRHGGLPDDDRKLAKIARLGTRKWSRHREILVSFFGDNWSHKRIDSELRKSEEKSEKARASANYRHARKSPKPKDKRNANAYANAEQTQCLSQSQSYTTHSSAREAGENLTECRKAVMAAYAETGFVGTPDTGYCAVWQSRGWDLSMCVEAVRSGLAKKSKFVPLKYFDGMIADWHAKPPDGVAQPRAGPARKSENTMFAAVQRRQKAKAKTHEPDRNVIELSPIADTSWSVAGKG